MTERENIRPYLVRVEHMADNFNEMWDLSEEDTAALKVVLKDRQSLAEKVNELNASLRESERLRAVDAARGLDLYNELLYAVGMKHPNGETRHQTALRYIQQAEHRGDSQAACRTESTGTTT